MEASYLISIHFGNMCSKVGKSKNCFLFDTADLSKNLHWQNMSSKTSNEGKSSSSAGSKTSIVKKLTKNVIKEVCSFLHPTHLKCCCFISNQKSTKN